MDFMKVLEERRSIDYFDPARPVSEHTLRQIIQAAALTPSAFNLQPWNLMVFRTQESRDRLAEACGQQRKLSDAPVVVMVLGDKQGWRMMHPAAEQAWASFVELGYMNDGLREWYEEETQALFGSEKESTIFAVKNAAMFAMSFMLCARNQEVDTHPIGGYDHGKLAREFGIPDTFVIVMLLACGHLNKKYRLLPPKWRKGYDEIVLDTL